MMVLSKGSTSGSNQKRKTPEPVRGAPKKGASLDFSLDDTPYEGGAKDKPKQAPKKKKENQGQKRKRGRPKKEPKKEVEEPEVASSESEDSVEKEQRKRKKPKAAKKATPKKPDPPKKKPAAKRPPKKEVSESEEEDSASGEETEAEVEKEKARTFTFTLNDSQLKAPEGQDKAFMDFLKRSHETSKKGKTKGGKGKGQKYVTDYRGQRVTVRLDRQKTKYYPRTSFGEEPKKEEEVPKTRGRRAGGRTTKAPKIKDLKTKELQGLLRKSGDNGASFLQGVRGEKLTSKAEGAAAAHKEGIGVRAVLLSSDAIDYPDNASVTIALLKKVTAANYEQLFSGGNYEGSYGALPSQNTNTKLEGAQERTGPYAALGSFVKDKTFDKSNAISNIPTLRKFHSFASFDPSLVTIKSGEDEVPLEDFSTEVRRQAIKARKKKKRDILPHDSVFSDPEDESENEQEKYGVLEEGHLDEMDKELAAIKAKLERKQRLIQALLASKREERARQEEEPKSEEEEEDTPKPKAKPSSLKRKEPPKKKQQESESEEDEGDVSEDQWKVRPTPRKKEEPSKVEQESEEDEIFQSPKKQKKAATKTPRKQATKSTAGRGRKPNNTTRTYSLSTHK